MATAVRDKRSVRDAGAAGGGASGFRPDIDGLRAVAILLVVAYHAGVPGLQGGFVGVDVFFVISGFLITGLLVAELDGTGTVGLARFWARRARRLLPAASLVTVCVLLAGLVVLSPLDWGRLAGDAFATATYRANLLFGGRATNYFETGVRASPLLHMWSLAVEEQFYLVWPLLLLVVQRVGRTSSIGVGRLRFVVIALVSALSLALCVSLTNANSPWAFFSPLSRAWELGAGGVLALAAPALARRAPRLRQLLGVLGGFLLVAALAVIDQHTAFPGQAALLPVAATALLVAAGLRGPSAAARTASVSRLLAARPLQAIGRVSYAWYLWHWPVLALGAASGWTSPAARSGLVGLSLGLAIVSHRLVENPVRWSPALSASNRRTAAVAALLLALTAGVAGGVEVRADEALRDPFLRALDNARRDLPPLRAVCATTDAPTIERLCQSGDPNGGRTILVIGDSHAAQWLPAIDVAARGIGAKVFNSLQGNCPALGVALDRELPSCAVRRRHLQGLMDALHPDLVVVSHSIGYVGALVGPSGAPIAGDQQVEAWGDALYQLAAHLKTTGTPLAVILDTPRYATDPIDCLAKTRAAGRCAISRSEAVARLAPVHDAEAAALRRAGHGQVLDPVTFLCDAAHCPLLDRGLVTYSDTHHLAASYSRTLADHLEPFLAASLP